VRQWPHRAGCRSGAGTLGATHLSKIECKKKHRKQQAASSKSPRPGFRRCPNPYLVAHPPTKNPTLLAVSVILFVVWFLFLLMAAISSSSR
jgi:hypothetical protein